MAVITFGGGGISEFGYLAVKSLEICFGHTFMTSATGTDDFIFKAGLVRARNFMGRVTIVASGKLFADFYIFRKMNTLRKLLIDAAVTIRAHMRYIILVYGGERIVMRQNMVSGMTIGTHRGDHETAFEKSLAVNAHRIILNYFVLFAFIPDGRFAAFTMTPSA